MTGKAGCLQVLPFEQTAQLLEDVTSLKDLHFDAATGHFLDYGNHTEALQLQHVVYNTPQGQFRGPLQRRLMDPSRPPGPQLVPHFGWVPANLLCKKDTPILPLRAASSHVQSPSGLVAVMCDTNK